MNLTPTVAINISKIILLTATCRPLLPSALAREACMRGARWLAETAAEKPDTLLKDQAKHPFTLIYIIVDGNQTVQWRRLMVTFSGEVMCAYHMRQAYFGAVKEDDFKTFNLYRPNTIVYRTEELLG